MYGQGNSAALPATGLAVAGTVLFGITVLIVGVALLGVVGIYNRRRRRLPMP